MGIVLAAVVFVVALIGAAVVAARTARREADAEAIAKRERARGEAAAQVAAARSTIAATRLAEETAAKAAALEAELAIERELTSREAALDKREDQLARAQTSLQGQLDTLDARSAGVDDQLKDAQSRHDRAHGLSRDAERRGAELRVELERRAGVQGAEIIARLSNGWLEEAKAQAAAKVRSIEQAGADPQHDRDARRILEISASRYQNHFLTERAESNLRVGSDIVSILLDDGGAIHKAIELVAGVQLQVNDDRDAVRLDGLDGVGKELVRRAMTRFVKKPESIDEARKAPEEWIRRGREALEQEIRALGKKAFAVLGVPRSHPEIVELVGALNFRHSFTQNQWLHAVEASFLAGMMAAEMGLDEKLARRATLMHDIGKALTHKIEGSHAVIGADIARRLGEPEVIANAIGSHHADEPANSAYAYLVAAADAMSGARPGARREMQDGFTAKVEDLERIGMARRGVAFAHAVHGGRELRVYVREGEVDDATVVEMSGDIAAQIAEEMSFPGQIKVTVIRSFEAVASAN